MLLACRPQGVNKHQIYSLELHVCTRRWHAINDSVAVVIRVIA